MSEEDQKKLMDFMRSQEIPDVDALMSIFLTLTAISRRHCDLLFQLHTAQRPVEDKK